MAVLPDAATQGGPFTGVSPHTVSHTPVGTPSAVVVFVTQGGTAAGNDTITGVTYGGVTVPRIATNGWASDVGGEFGGAFCHFLGSGIPTGVQDCVVSTNGGSAVKIITVITATAASDTEVAASGKLEGDAANPQIALDSGTSSALRYAAIYSGSNVLTDLTGLNTAVASHDWGNFITKSERQASASTGSVTMGWTGLIDDVAMVALAIRESSTATAVGRSFAVPYQVLSSVGRSFALPYEIVSSVGRSFASPYSIVGSPQVRATNGVTSGTLSGPSSSWTLTKPTGAVQNDVLVAVLVTGTTSLVATPPAGFTQVWSRDQGTEQTQHVYVKVLGEFEPSTYAFALNGSEIGSWAMLAVQNASTTAPVNTSASGTTVFGTSHDTPSITPTVDGCLLLAVFSNNAASTAVTYTPPAEMTEQFDLSEATSFISLAGSTIVQPAAAAVTKTATSSGSDSTAAGILAITPGAPVPVTVGRSFTARYAVLGSALAANVTSRVGRRGKRGVRQPVGVTAGAIIGTLGRRFALPYGIAGPVGRSVALPYAIGEGVSRNFALAYTVGATPTATRYLSPTGSNANDGLTSATPWQTQLYAIQNAPSPCEVLMLGGIYPRFALPAWTSRTGYVTFKPAPSATVIVNGFSLASATNWVAYEGVRFEGFASFRGANWRFINNVFEISAANTRGSAIAMEDGSSEVTIEDNLMTGTNVHFAVYWLSGNGQPLITNTYARRNIVDGTRHGGFNVRGFENCWIEDNIIRNVVGVATDGTHKDSIRTAYGGNGWHVHRNLVHDNDAMGIFMKDGAAVTNAYVTDNVVLRNVGSIQEFQFYNVDGLTLVNNTTDGKIAFGTSGGVTVADKITMFNNIASQILKYATFNPIYRDYNLAASWVGLTPNANDRTGAATFINEAANDVRLAAGSLGVDQGAPVGGGYAVTLLDHLKRPRPPAPGELVDMGAYERQVGDP